MKKIFIVLIVIILISNMPFCAFAVNEAIIDVSIATITDVEDIEQCVQTEIKGKCEVKSIDSFAMKKINDLECDKAVIVETLFNNIGIVFSEESYMQKNIVDNLDEIKNISANICYTKVDSEGLVTYMDKESCLKELSDLETSSSRTASNTYGIITDGTEKTSDNGYMKTSIAYFYNGNGYYILVGQWDWLKEPAITRKDAFSLYSTNLSWANSGGNNYEKITSYYSYIVQNGQVIEDKTIRSSTLADPTIEPEGVFYTWNLPTSTSNSTTTCIYSDYMCQLWATARVQDYDDYTQNLSVYSRYVHKKVSVSTTYSISATKKGVAIGVSDSTTTAAAKAYPHYFTWDYLTDAQANGEI